MGRRRLMVVVGLLVVAMPAAGAQTAAHAAPPNTRIDLRVLVISDGGPTVEALAQQLDLEGIPSSKVNLNGSGRPTINAGFLSDTIGTIRRAKFESVILPSDAPPGLTIAELDAVRTFEREFGLRQIDAYTWPTPAVGLNFVNTGTIPGYAGALDGFNATASATAKSNGHAYLQGPVPFEDRIPGVGETYGYIAVPIADAAQPQPGATFRSFLDAPIPGSSSAGSLLGVYTRDGREELVNTFATNIQQLQFQLLAHGMITWVTRGVHLGFQRNYFTSHIDDIFLANARWNPTLNCTPGSDCPPVPDSPTIRMTPADVAALTAWQNANGYRFDLAFNGSGSANRVTLDGADPLTDAFLGAKSQFRWLNHTWSHEFVGCLRDFTVSPWRCVTDAGGNVQWMIVDDIYDQININLFFATDFAIPIDRTELVTGEHSGLFVLPQQPVDNPGFAPVLDALGVKTIGSDNSRDPLPRAVGGARTVPRYPLDLFFNVGTKAEEVDEFNWIYGRAADGGSGICEVDPRVTCLAPLDLNSGFDAVIVPRVSQLMVQHILANDPRPHYVHQSNFSEERLGLSVFQAVLARYRSLVAPSAPVVSQSMTATSTMLQAHANWRSVVSSGNRVTGYVLNRQLHLQISGGAVSTPITVPNGTTFTNGSAFGASYGNERSAWRSVGSTELVLNLPTGTF